MSCRHGDLYIFFFSFRDVLFTASVAELRRKAQEHSAALWQSLQQIQGDAANISSPIIPELSLPTVPEPAKNLEKMPKDDATPSV